MNEMTEAELKAEKQRLFSLDSDKNSIFYNMRKYRKNSTREEYKKFLEELKQTVIVQSEFCVNDEEYEKLMELILLD